MNEDEIEFDGRPAPLKDCNRKVCVWVRSRNLPDRLIRPADPEWETLLRRASRFVQ
jgi:hypothetical protein